MKVVWTEDALRNLDEITSVSRANQAAVFEKDAALQPERTVLAADG